jgi:hypothetical protein
MESKNVNPKLKIKTDTNRLQRNFFFEMGNEKVNKIHIKIYFF